MEEKLRITPSNPALEENGVWANYHGVELRVRRLQPTELAAFKRTLDGKPADAWEPYMAPLAATLLLEWRNFPGKLEATPANMLRLMEEDVDARMFVMNLGSMMQAFIDGAAQVRVGNSSAASTGNSGTSET